ncbi:SAM-dependent methyltransferase [Ammoniphilus resinae]|uniref:Cyclopropane-fatty-acyl-phospholipid synthase n=1 Tax=Ammoniphilus resinae TaxID=861532 RepID=A0ABS4GSY3_9BACL|nr:cyclopropane-fatty-acyl-phospholipid synthase family protein [Ammoniphilus resinae]MBP1933376.1 cyclopropane-fatty-acyl-phospholipid synthase [Ammoniphilus resinae]
MQKYMLERFFQGLSPRHAFQIRYWDGTSEIYGDGEPNVTIIFNEKISIAGFLKEKTLTFGDAYMNGSIEIEGKIEDVISLAISNKEMLWTKSLSFLPKLTSLGKRKENIQHHYDIGNEFYSLWLDETMSYSCAYFKSPKDSLHQAQLQKIDHVLKKLQLKKGERLLDIGSGWGWLILRAAQQYGVKSFGVTISEEQYRKTKERIRSLGLEGQVDVALMDYTELARKGYSYDKIASVGMFEHVGKAHYPIFMKTVHELLGEKGLVLLHTITHQTEVPVDPWIEKNIFPGGYIPSLREIVMLLPDYDFHLLDVESLRLHYAKTLDHWAERFEQQVEKVEQMYDQRFVRMWRLYLQSSAAFFRNGGLNIHQFLFSKGVNNELELTRDFLYS